jgi:hypothetical protein
VIAKIFKTLNNQIILPTSYHSRPLESSYYIKIGDFIHFQKLIKAFHAFIIHHQPPLFQKVKDSCNWRIFFFLGTTFFALTTWSITYTCLVVWYILACFVCWHSKLVCHSTTFCPSLGSIFFVSYNVCETHLVWELSLQLPCISCTMHGASKF